MSDDPAVIAAKAITPDPTPEPLDDDTLVRLAQERGFLIHRPARTAKVHRFNPARIKGNTVRLAVVSDTHLGSKHQQVTYLHDFYSYAEERKVHAYLHCGDWLDGSFKMHRDMAYRGVFAHGFDAQLDYAVGNYPKPRRRDIKTYGIGGNHDESFSNDTGADVVHHLAQARPDIEYLGYPSAYFDVGPIRILLRHPSGGPGFALSYMLQRYIDGLASENKPHILLTGHYHVAAHLPSYRNVDAFLLPCFKSQDIYLDRKGLYPAIGGLILEFDYGDEGLRRISPEWVLFRSPLAGDYPGGADG